MGLLIGSVKESLVFGTQKSLNKLSSMHGKQQSMGLLVIFFCICVAVALLKVETQDGSCLTDAFDIK